jgi:hypothetical protein
VDTKEAVMRRPGLTILALAFCLAGCSKNDSDTGLPKDKLDQVSADIKQALKKGKVLEPRIEAEIEKCERALEYIKERIAEVEKRKSNSAELQEEAARVKERKKNLEESLTKLRDRQDLLRARIVASLACNEDPKVQEALQGVLEQIEVGSEAIKRSVQEKERKGSGQVKQ